MTSDMTVTSSLSQPTHSNAPASAPPTSQLKVPEQPCRAFHTYAGCGGLPLNMWSLTLSSSRQAPLHYTLTLRGEDAEPHLRASNEGLRRPRVARATEVGVLAPPPSPFCFRRRPVQLRMSSAVEAGEAVAGFAPGIRHGGKGDGGIVEGASGLIV